MELIYDKVKRNDGARDRCYCYLSRALALAAARVGGKRCGLQTTDTEARGKGRVKKRSRSVLDEDCLNVSRSERELGYGEGHDD